LTNKEYKNALSSFERALDEKKEDDKRNTYIEITDKGEELLLRLMEEYDPENNSVFNGALALRNFYGKFPENIELIAILRNIYGQDFIFFFREYKIAAFFQLFREVKRR
ncbi:hypothetical protein ACT453_11240, partial [Bacillus sp. D-CC]